MKKSNWDIIRKPLVTEKSMKKQEKGVYTFIVDKTANKAQIKGAIESAYKNVKVADIRTVGVRGKNKRMKNMLLSGQRKNWKKAYVTLREGDRLDII